MAAVRGAWKNTVRVLVSMVTMTSKMTMTMATVMMMVMTMMMQIAAEVLIAGTTIVLATTGQIIIMLLRTMIHNDHGTESY